MIKIKRIIVLVSGGGTNLQAIIDAKADGKITNGEIVGVISSKSGVKALERAEKASIPAYILERKQFSSNKEYSEVLLSLVDSSKPDIIVLAGKGHETYQILNTGKIHFDEREVVAEILAVGELSEPASNP